MNCQQTLENLHRGTLDACLCALYGKEALDDQRLRYQKALTAFAELYGKEREITIFSVPGRSELSGNHTDHNRGLAIAAAVSADVIAVASARTDSIVTLHSEGFDPCHVDLDDFVSPRKDRYARSDALIAGVAAGLRQRGFAAGGFDAYTTSDVPRGSGLSSSAAFEVLLAQIQNHFYNADAADATTLAKIAKYAENEFFGKPCGLLDQLAVATGGIIAIDFKNAESPLIERIDFDLNAAGYSLLIVNTGGNHADLTADYAAIPAEMHAVAMELGGEVLRDVDEIEFTLRMNELREKLGDRAVLRALHFYAENMRVTQQKKALEKGDLDTFFRHVIASGRSSFQFLQNVYSPSAPHEQGLSLALYTAERIVDGKGGAFRVHGGGFAGTIQLFLPTKDTGLASMLMDGFFGRGSCMVLRVRQVGTKIIE